MRRTIWCNRFFQPAAMARLREGTRAHQLVLSEFAGFADIMTPAADPALDGADIAFGQPPVEACLSRRQLQWVHVSSAGYTRYDTLGLREAFRERGAALTRSSSVYADPCAQHVLGMMLALGRKLLDSHRDQMTDRSWNYAERRYQSRRLTGETVLLLGFGAIGCRLAELLAPFSCTVYAVRRQTRSERGVRIIAEEELTRVLPLAHHVVNLLPDNETTLNWVNARRLSCLRPGAFFYNVGRGTTVDQSALIDALETGRLGAAYLDVADPEPLPPNHPLWSAPRCYLTPHTAGGRTDQDEAVVEHFLENLSRHERGMELKDRVV